MAAPRQESNGKSKSEKFVRIAARRTTRVLDGLRLLGQCSNRRSYAYTPEQVDKILREIRRAVRDTEQKFKRNSSKTEFKL